MKVETSVGEVELTADMVRPGMVFADRDGMRIVLRSKDVDGHVWYAAETDVPVVDLLSDQSGLLGCDPTVAAREDVERYGVAPGIDAGAHWFARLRGGGAVDMRKAGARFGWVIGNGGSRYRATLKHRNPVAIGEEQRLIGLDARHASPEDVERLCCGVRETADRFDAAAGVYLSARWHCCTLAIGDHAEHEDIATGTRWPAENATTSPTPGTPAWIISMVADDGYSCTVERGAPGTVAVKVHGAPWSYCYGLQLRLADETPGNVDVSVEPAAEPQGLNPAGTYRCLGCDECVPHGTPHDCARHVECEQAGTIRPRRARR